jgi:putative FmdB family regulatory protein
MLCTSRLSLISMPTYEFRCPLGHEFERFYRSIGTAESQTTCPECGQMAERFMSVGAGLVFKGSGFYLTDYGKNAHQKKDPAEAKSDGSKSEGGTSDAKTGESAGASESKGDSKSNDTKPAESKPAESKPATPPKPSSGE